MYLIIKNVFNDPLSLSMKVARIPINIFINF